MSAIKEAVNGRKKLRESLSPYVIKESLQKKDKEEENENHADWAYALFDINHIICKELSYKDLCSLAKVNTSWRDGALQEIDRRPYIQSLRLTFDLSNDTIKSAVKTVLSKLQVKPHVSLLIYEDNDFGKSSPLKEKRIKGKLLDDFEKDLSPNTIAFKVTECLSTEDLNVQNTSNRHLGVYNPKEHRGLVTVNGGLLGIFFPTSEKRTCVRVAWEPQNNDLSFLLSNVVVTRLARNLCLEECKEPSALLMFVAPGHYRATRIAFKLSQKVNQDKETLWLGEVGGKLDAASNCHGQYHRSSDQLIVALRISGPSLQSWAAYIDLRLPRSTVRRELHELREKVIPKRYCSGLLSAPCQSSYGLSYEIMNDVRSIFPEIPFVGMFDNHTESPKFDHTFIHFGRDYTYMSIIIISYDD